MTASPPRIFDRRLRRLRWQRAAPRFGGHDVLYRRVVTDIADRLKGVRRRFGTAIAFGERDGTLAEALAPSCDRVLTALPREGGRPAAHSIRAEEEWLPFAPSALDLVVSVLEFHAINDVPGALSQIARALKPDGLFIGAFFGGETLHELRQSLTRAEAALRGGASPRVAPMIDIRDAGSLLQRAGFALPVADSDRVTLTYPHALALLHDLRGMGETNILVERDRCPLRKAVLAAALTEYERSFAGANGRVPATIEIITMTGWAPHESQQRPLAPGSARMRLADALMTKERPLED
ncbi:MAG: methyltransferase domain-containing protein [Alphaproteobacteria bacterium]|nr:methyltransferase domain-containing protein [Alphaproteobacteria bacterium]